MLVFHFYRLQPNTGFEQRKRVATISHLVTYLSFCLRRLHIQFFKSLVRPTCIIWLRCYHVFRGLVRRPMLTASVPGEFASIITTVLLCIHAGTYRAHPALNGRSVQIHCVFVYRHVVDMMIDVLCCRRG